MTRLFALALVAVACATPAQAGILVAVNNTPGLFDASSGNRTVAFTGAEPGFGDGIVQKVLIAINFAKADGESFDPPFPGGTPFYNEIVFRLTSPNGTVVDLITAGSFNTGSGQFDGTILFDDAAAQIVNVNPNTPQAGTFRPIGSLATQNGGPALGNWTLFIQDTVGADALRFRSFTLTVTTGVADVPEPGTLVLFGALAVAGAGYARRRLKGTPVA